ncbi:MAG: tetratricopeptide repeat protein [Burkholderiales bacterium]
MTAKSLQLLLAALLALAGAPPALADAEEEFENGYEAYAQRDYAQAVSRWRQAAEQGHPRAQNGLGVLYRDGLGTMKNDRAAARWFRESAEKGYAFGMFNLGMLYRDGSGVARDDIEAHKWLTLASSVHYDKQAALERDLLARRMSAQQKEEAAARAQAWLDRFFFGKNEKRSRLRDRVPATE